jgi:acyl-CoA thioesterase
MSIEGADRVVAQARQFPAEHPFDRATTVRRDAHGLSSATTSDDYWAFVGPFGGITAATMLRAILDHPERAGDPLSLTTNFCAPVARGDYELSTRLVRATRSTQHWVVELSQPEAGVSAIASAVFATRRPSWAHQPAACPIAPAFDTTPAYRFVKPAPAWISQYEFRFISGAPGFDTGASTPNSAASLVWMRDHQPRQLDVLSLAAISDAFFGRIFQALGRVVPFGTVSMTTYFHADSEDLSAEDATMVLGAADGRSFSKNYGDQVGELWSPSGRLLATTTQMAYYKA